MPTTPANDRADLEALHASVDRLRSLADRFDDDALTQPAYPSEWTVADVLSHLGSGAVITARRLQDALNVRETPDDFAPGVWDEWNAKAPAQQRRDALKADAQLLAALDAVSGEDRARVTFAMGPMSLDFTDYVAMRLNEHAFHTWDIEVVRDAAATLPTQVAEVVVDHLELVARFTAKPTGDTRQVKVTTTLPKRAFVVDLTEDGATMRPSDDYTRADLVLPAEAFARLVYGRLDPAHTPIPGTDLLDELRMVFPGP